MLAQADNAPSVERGYSTKKKKMHSGAQGLESFSPSLQAGSFLSRVDGLSVHVIKLFRDLKHGTNTTWTLQGRIRSG